MDEIRQLTDEELGNLNSLFPLYFTLRVSVAQKTGPDAFGIPIKKGELMYYRDDAGPWHPWQRLSFESALNLHTVLFKGNEHLKAWQNFVMQKEGELRNPSIKSITKHMN
jgi:hypothetical protein